MFSGTAFKTLDGRIGTIYQGNGNVIAIAKDKSLEQWEKPYRILPKNPRGVDEKLFRHWDPDLFVVNGTYYAVFGNLYFDLEKVPFLSKSKDLKNWEYVGPLMSKEMDDVLTAEDVSCANFFKLGEKWMLLCISHARGARYYIGEWDKTDEQFVPEFHGRLNHRHIYPSLPYCSIFAPESLLTDDGRRIVWFWLDGAGIGVQTLPRKFSLPSDGILRMKPARELESLRLDKKTCKNLEVKSNPETSEQRVEYLFDLPSDAVEIGAEISRREAEMNRVGFELFSDGDKNRGVQILFCADYKTLRVSGVEIPFELKTLPPNENLKIRIFVDKHIVEVFVNDRIAAAAIGRNPQIRKFHALGFKRPYKIEKIDVWNLKPANKGYKDALKNGIVK